MISSRPTALTLSSSCRSSADSGARKAQHRQAEAGHLAGEDLAGLQQIALDHLVDDADPLGLVGLHGASGQDQLGGARLADQAWQALRAAIAGYEAELDLGK